MTEGQRAIVVGDVKAARAHGDGVMADMTSATIGQAEDDRPVLAVFTNSDLATLLEALPLERFDRTDQLSVEETIEALRRDRT